MDIDDPSTTELRNEIIQSKPVLKTIYEEWYNLIRANLPALRGPVLELGSGAGFLRTRIPDLITSEVFPCRNAQLLLDGQSLPFRSQTLRAVAMTNVLHHIPRPAAFLAEAHRCLLPGGALLMIEPWVSTWSKIVYTRLHHEPFDTSQREWSHSYGGPLSGANGALPWIIFERDRPRFEEEFSLRIERIQPMMPFRYLFSGGVSMRQLMPTFLDPVCAWVERGMQPWMKHWAMFVFVSISRPGAGGRLPTDDPWSLQLDSGQPTASNSLGGPRARSKDGGLLCRSKDGGLLCRSKDRGILCRKAYYSAKTRCTNWTAMDPSPTAAATRFKLPARTSPTANTPGRLVSSM